MDLLVVRGELTRMELVDVMMKIEEGHHVENPFVEYVKAKAFYIEPRSEGCFSFDGEAAEYTPVKVQVHPSLVTLLG
jgi:diacylglycerol kinase family enzyme